MNTFVLDPLHGITLEKIVTELVDLYGFEHLGYLIPVNCFNSDPSIKSSLTFLRKTPWARKKVEDLYVDKIINKRKA
ncbi:MAG: DUF2132 domain-containing protein [Fluviicola sp.]|nr:DUF2132 domain-containing protein [Fluviicola sp.]MBP6271712.1 DUF2132 domain-containing protein [Fluviicola sp.]